MPTKNNPFRIRSKIWIENKEGQIIFGAGRLEILAAIVRNGSIHAAAKELKMSYRAVWGKLKDTEDRLGKPLLVRQIGGTSGGGSGLTDFAKKLLQTFADFQTDVENDISNLFEKSFSPRDL